MVVNTVKLIVRGRVRVEDLGYTADYCIAAGKLLAAHTRRMIVTRLRQAGFVEIDVDINLDEDRLLDVRTEGWGPEQALAVSAALRLLHDINHSAYISFRDNPSPELDALMSPLEKAARSAADDGWGWA